MLSFIIIKQNYLLDNLVKEKNRMKNALTNYLDSLINSKKSDNVLIIILIKFDLLLLNK